MIEADAVRGVSADVVPLPYLRGGADRDII
jgi:hypothetical protein